MGIMSWLLFFQLITSAQGVDKEISTRSAIIELIEGDERGAKAAEVVLRRRGSRILGELVTARLAVDPGRPRAATLGEIIFLGKEARAEYTGCQGLYQKLRRVHVKAVIESRSYSEVAGWIRSELGLEIETDPGTQIADKPITLDMQGVPAWRILDRICGALGLDYDCRFSRVFISSPARLWAIPKRTLSDADAAAAQAWLANLASDSLVERERATKAIKELGPHALPIVESGLGSKEPEIAARCRMLYEEFVKPEYVDGEVPSASSYRRQQARFRGTHLAGFLSAEIGVDEDSTTVKGVVATLEEITAELKPEKPVTVRFKSHKTEKPFGLRAKNLDVLSLLELVALPRGMDVRIEEGVIVIADSR